MESKKTKNKPATKLKRPKPMPRKPGFSRSKRSYDDGGYLK